MDSAPAHHLVNEAEFLEEFDFIAVKFLPHNTTLLIQPMDQQVTYNFKKPYIKELFQRRFEVTSAMELTLCDFCKNRFKILYCLGLTDKA